jgi:hypothetical protein
MQVNSAQDYLTARKRQIIGNIYASDPPAKAKNKSGYNYTILQANRATQYTRFVSAACCGNQTCTGLGKTYTSNCCVSSGTILY